MPVGVSAYTPLANFTLGSNAATVTFSSINQSFRDLVMIVVARNASSTSNPALQFNSDTTSGNYVFVTGEANSGSRTSTVGANAFIPAGNNFAALVSGSLSITRFDILDYTATNKHKTVISRVNNASAAVGMAAGRWQNTSAITTVRLLTGNGTSYASGATFMLYGVSS